MAMLESKQRDPTLDAVAAAGAEPQGGIGQWIITNVGRLVVSLFVPLVTFLVLWQVFIFLRDSNLPNWVTAIVAVVWGVGGVMALFVAANMVIELFPAAWRRRLTPFVFVGPALAILAWYLLLPTIRSAYASLFSADSTTFVGLQNYAYAFTSPAMLESFRNNLFWLVLGTGFSVGLGLLIAVLADRTHPTFETVIKALVFMPMAISMVGASIIWKSYGNSCTSSAPRRKPDRLAECCRDWARRASPGLAACSAMEQPVLDCHPHLDADRLLPGDPFRCHQRHPLGVGRSRADRWRQ